MSEYAVDKRQLFPVLAGFFVMGFCDMIAPITNLVAADFPDEYAGAVSFLPTMVFLWFLLLSVPMAGMMNRIGRKNTAMAGYILTMAGLVVPYTAGADCPLWRYFAGFGLLGIGNTAIQVAVNPMLAAIAPAEKMTSYLTVGQIFRNTSLLLLAPLVAWLTAEFGSWRYIMPVYAGITVVCGIWLNHTRMDEYSAQSSAGFGECFRLLGNRTVAVCTAGVACFIAGDVGVGYLSAQLVQTDNPILITTGYYACRIVGTIAGAVVLTRISDLKYLTWNMAAAIALCAGVFFTAGCAPWVVFLQVGLMGFTMACIFATLFASATKAAPGRENEASGLMILAISAGALSAPIIGVVVRTVGEARWGLVFVAACLCYILWASRSLARKNGAR
ncbi:MAG: MFS transporter [Alistipes sp.]|nr:MFS transporter [Alistipes sp.]